MRSLRQHVKDEVDIEIIEGESQVGSGSVPLEKIKTLILQIKTSNMSAEELAKKLRYNNPPIFTRVRNDAVLLDFRTIQPEEDRLVLEALTRLL